MRETRSAPSEATGFVHVKQNDGVWWFINADGEGFVRLGVTSCACMFDQGGETLKKGKQNGFYDLEGNPREGLIKAVTDINHAVYEHTPQPASAEELAQRKADLFATWDKYSVRPHRLKNANRSPAKAQPRKQAP